MAEKRGQYVYNDDGTVSMLVSISGADSNGGGLGVTTNDIIPVDIQNRSAQTIQTHSAALVGAANGYSVQANWMDCDGFSDIAVTISNDAATSSYLDIQWSHDGTNVHGVETAIVTATAQRRVNQAPVKARWAKIALGNSDAAPHTMNAFVLLKA